MFYWEIKLKQSICRQQQYKRLLMAVEYGGWLTDWLTGYHSRWRWLADCDTFGLIRWKKVPGWRLKWGVRGQAGSFRLFHQRPMAISKAKKRVDILVEVWWQAGPLLRMFWRKTDLQRIFSGHFRFVVVDRSCLISHTNKHKQANRRFAHKGLTHTPITYKGHVSIRIWGSEPNH